MKLVLLSAFGLLLAVGCGIPESAAIAQAQPAPTAPPADNSAPSNATAAAATTNAPPVVASQPPAPQLPPNLPEPAREIVKLSHSQVDDGVVTNFIANIREPFHLDAEQIVYLRDLGLTPAVLEALLAREQQLESAVKEPPSATAAASPAPAPANGPSVAATVYPGGKPELAPPQVSPAVETAPTAEPPPAEPSQVNYNFFYDSLAPYGNWFTVPTYGYVWQPTCAVITPGWRPYWNNGCWNWCDSGWYWNSYYSWGWAPFHYGNWVSAPGRGWCWVPGSTWSPSWVTFRYGGGYCGWAPLPPGCGVSTGVGLTWGGSGVGVSFGFGFAAGDYCWTPTSYFTAPNCWAYGVYGSGVNQIYNNSTVINNYVVGNNNTVINGGIHPDKISRGEIRKMQLSEASSPAGAGVGGTRGRPGSDNMLPVYRPVVGSSGGSADPGASRPGGRQEVRPTAVASRPSGLSPASSSLSRRPDLNQPDRLPAPNPRTPAVALHSGSGSRRGSAAWTGRTGSPSASTPGAVGRPGGNGAAPANPSLIGRGGAPYGNLPGGAAPSGRLEPRKAPVASRTPNPGLPAGSDPGSGASRPAVGVPSAPMPSRSGTVGNVRQSPQFQPQVRTSPATRFNPRPNVSAPTPIPSYRAPSVPRMQSPPAVSMSRPSGGFGGAAPRGGGGGGMALRGRP